MAMSATGLPRVQVSEQDLSARTPQGRGVYAGCVVPARRGPVHPVLVTGPGNFNNRYTVRGKIEVSDLLNMYACRDTTERTDKTWMVRAVSPSALIGGANIYRAGAASNENAAFLFGYKDILNYDPTTTDGYPQIANSAADFSDFANDVVEVAGILWATLRTGNAITISSGGTGAVQPGGVVYGTTYYAIVLNEVNKIKLAATALEAAEGTAINITSAGTGLQNINSPTRTVIDDDDARALTLFAKNPGDWAKNLSARITHYATNKTLVREPGCFAIEIFNFNTRVETLVGSRNPEAKGQDGRSLYIENVAERSEFVDVVNNITLDETILPAEQLTLLPFGGGSDGQAITDGDMIRALALLQSRANYPMSIIHDSGWSTPAYAGRIETFCETRGDCSFREGVPYAVEASSDYLNLIDKYASEDRISDTSFGGMYTPHKKFYDEDNNRYIHVSPTGHVAGMFARAFDVYRPGEPVAGLEKGSFDADDLLRRYDDPELSFLYDINVNPIRWKRGTGIHLWGQKTRQRRPSALDRLNVRDLLNGIKGPYADALEGYLFRLNQLEDDTGLRAEIRAVIDSRAEALVGMGSIFAYKTKIDKDNNTPNDVDNHILRIWHMIKPAPSIEYIDFVIGITSTGIDFQIAQSALQ